MSTPRSLDLPDLVRSVVVQTRRGAFAALQARPASGVCERRPAVLVPGFTGSKEDFIPVLQPLASAGRHVVAIDMRGQYQTAAAATHDGYSPDELAADIAAVAAAVTPDDGGAHLLGHSLGGLIVRHAVLAGATAPASLTLLGSGPASITGRRHDTLRAMLALLANADGEAASAAAASAEPASAEPASTAAASAAAASAEPTSKAAASAHAASAAAVADPGRLRAWAERLWDSHLEPQARAEGVAEHIIAFLRERHLGNCPTGLVVMGNYLLTCPDRTAELARLGAPPILVMYGENDDAWPPAVQDRMARRLHAQRVCIPGAAHSPAIEAPETTASTLTSFWNAAEETRRRQRRRANGYLSADIG